jgi:hypothetical protein
MVMIATNLQAAAPREKKVVVFLDHSAESFKQVVSDYIQGITGRIPEVRTGNINLAGLRGNEMLLAVNFCAQARFDVSAFIEWVAPITPQLQSKSACVVILRYGSHAGEVMLDQRLTKYETFQVAVTSREGTVIPGALEYAHLGKWIHDQLQITQSIAPQVENKHPQQTQIAEAEVIAGIEQLSNLLQNYSKNDPLKKILNELSEHLDEALAKIIQLH